MAIEFDNQCATAQVEDALQLFIPARVVRRTCPDNPTVGVCAVEQDIASTHWPVLKKFHGQNCWPKQAVILPGTNFVLETFLG